MLRGACQAIVFSPADPWKMVHYPFVSPRSLPGHSAAMIFAPFHFTRYAILFVLLLTGNVSSAAAAPPAHRHDPCVKIAGRHFVDPGDAIACQKSFPFNETLRQNVLSVISRVFDFYTFEDFYLHSPPPFQGSTTDIRAEIRRINSTRYAVSSIRIFSEANPLIVCRRLDRL
jgi:hypothetical protein